MGDDHVPADARLCADYVNGELSYVCTAAMRSMASQDYGI